MGEECVCACAYGISAFMRDNGWEFGRHFDIAPDTSHISVEREREKEKEIEREGTREDN
jgi:hypothetical protein